MNKSLLLAAITGAWIGLSAAFAADDALPWKSLPTGVFPQNRTQLPAQDVEIIGTKLGAQIDGITQFAMRVQGRGIQVNVISLRDESRAETIHAALLKMKPALYCSRRGKLVFEYVGRDIDDALARKTSYELGLTPKPARVDYRIVAELATVDRADYMACNLLFNEFLKAGIRPGGGQPSADSIQSLAARFKFGRTLTLRNSHLVTETGSAARHSFETPSVRTTEMASAVRYEFADPLPTRHSVPFVTATLEVPVSDRGLTATNPAEKQNPGLTAPTAHWPAKEGAIMALAGEITRGKTGAEAKANAILEWLTPGRNIKYSGETGSRWGTLKVLEQRFGHCWDFSDCFVTLSRAAGVPARQVAGWLYGTSGHVWAEYYRDGVGWQQVDPTGGGSLACGIYYIAYFTSEDGEMPIVYVSMPKIEVTAGDAEK